MMLGSTPFGVGSGNWLVAWGHVVIICVSLFDTSLNVTKNGGMHTRGARGVVAVRGGPAFGVIITPAGAGGASFSVGKLRVLGRKKGYRWCWLLGLGNLRRRMVLKATRLCWRFPITRSISVLTVDHIMLVHTTGLLVGRLLGVPAMMVLTKRG